MNQTDDVFKLSVEFIYEFFDVFTAIFSAHTLIVCMILYYPVFPIFVYVFRRNRDKEKDSNVFPILQHFYRTTIFAYLFAFIVNMLDFYRSFHPEYITEYPTVFLITSQWVDFLTVFFEIHHFIIILLAVQRFVIYFELLVNLDLTPKAINVTLFMLYFIGYLKLAVFEIAIAVFRNVTMYLIYQKMLVYESIIIHILMFASASLYIPISVSIRRKSHLRSIIKNKPDRFILYQTIGLAVFKVTSLRLHIFEQFEIDEAQRSSVFYSNRYDFHTTPVMIQMSYLFSNQRNLDTIKNIFKRKNRTVPSIPPSESGISSTHIQSQPRFLIGDGVNRVAELAIRSPIV